MENGSDVPKSNHVGMSDQTSSHADVCSPFQFNLFYKVYILNVVRIYVHLFIVGCIFVSVNVDTSS